MVRPSAEALHGFALLRLVLAMAVSLFGRDPQRGTAWLQYESWSSKLGIPPLFRGNLHIVSYSNMISWYIMISCKPCKACVLNWNAYVWHIKKKLKYTYIKKNINMRGHTRDVSYMIMYCIWIRVKLLFFPGEPWADLEIQGSYGSFHRVVHLRCVVGCCWYFYPSYCGKTNKNNKPVGDVSFGTHLWQYWRLSIIYHRVYLSSSIYRIQLVTSSFNQLSYRNWGSHLVFGN